jgi:hypothetical protein
MLIFLKIMTLWNICSNQELSSQKKRPLLQSSTLVFLCGPHYFPTVTGMHGTIDELLETVFSMQSAPRLRNESILRCEFSRGASRQLTAEVGDWQVEVSTAQELAAQVLTRGSQR